MGVYISVPNISLYLFTFLIKKKLFIEKLKGKSGTSNLIKKIMKADTSSIQIRKGEKIEAIRAIWCTS